MNFDNAYKKPLCRFSVEQENGVHQAFDCAKALYLAAEQECYRTLSRTEMAAFLDAAAALQTEEGLIPLVIDKTMPSDCRVDLQYHPSYAAAAAAIYAWQTMREIFDEARTAFFKNLLHGCTGRGLRDHGLDAGSGQRRNLILLAKADVKAFVEENGDLCAEFTALVRDTIQMFHTFDMGASSFFSKSLIYRALQMLKDETIPNADIPYMHVKTIEYLLRQKKCICGTHLDEGTVAYENVKALMDYLPPQSISATASQFKKDAKNRIATLERTNLSASVAASYGLISDDADKITDAQDELRRVESQLATSVDVAAEVRKLQNEIFVCKKSASDQVRRIADLTSEQDCLTRERDTADTNRRELSLKDDKNRMIEICRSYALEIYNQLSEVYKKSETEVRTKLQATINEIFNDI